MKKLVSILYLITATCSISVFAATDSSAKSLNDIMTQVGATTVDIYPLIVAQRAFTNKDIERLDQALEKLSGLFQDAKPFIEKQPEGYQVSYEFISQYLDVVKTVLHTSHVDYARTHLYALGEICASCHTQDSTLRTLFSGTTRKAFADDYAYAELNYITRDYDDAVKYYEKFLNSPGRKTELNIIQPLQRIVTIYTQVQNDPRRGIQVLKKFTTYKQHTPQTLAELNNWISGLQALVDSGVADISLVTFDTLQKDVEKYLGNIEHLSVRIESNAKEEVQRVWLRGQLYHYLNKQAKENEIPMLLYWLAVVDR